MIELADERTVDSGRYLAEMGADVVVVEPPGGSEVRAAPPFLDDVAGPERSLRWWASAVGKRSVVLDLERSDDRDAFGALVAVADIVLEGRGVALEANGVGWASLGRARSDLIWVSITPFGRDSKRADEPTSDLTLLAGGGPLWNCGYDDHTLPPIRGAGGHAYQIGAFYGVIGALVALAHRDRTGRGQLVDVNINAACNVTSEQTTYNWLMINAVCERQTGRHAYHTPSAPVQIRCADGRYATTGVVPRAPKDYARLHEWLVELDLLDELPEAVFLEIAAQKEAPIDLGAIGEVDEVTAIAAAARDAMALIAARLPAKEFFVAAQRRGFPVGAVLSPEEAFEDEHFVARGFQVDVEHRALGRTFRHPGVPYLVDGRVADAPSSPPLLGEHTAEVLDEVRAGPHDE